MGYFGRPGCVGGGAGRGTTGVDGAVQGSQGSDVGTAQALRLRGELSDSASRLRSAKPSARPPGARGRCLN